MSDLTFGPSFKVKRWCTGFGELSFRWIQICIGSPMRRSSLILDFPSISQYLVGQMKFLINLTIALKFENNLELLIQVHFMVKYVHFTIPVEILVVLLLCKSHLVNVGWTLFLGGLRVTNPPIRLMCPTSVCPSTFFVSGL